MRSHGEDFDPSLEPVSGTHVLETTEEAKPTNAVDAGVGGLLVGPRERKGGSPTGFLGCIKWSLLVRTDREVLQMANLPVIVLILPDS